MRPDGGRRSGGALAAVIVVLVVIECIVLGTLHTALVERRVADNHRLMLQLRLLAESAAHAAVAAWPLALDRLAPGERRHPVPAAVAGAHATDAVVERLATALYLVRARAWPGERHLAAASVALMVVPPYLSGDAVPAAITAASLEVGSTGSIVIDDQCGGDDAAAAIVTGGSAPDPAARERIVGDVRIAPVEPAPGSAFVRARGAVEAAVAAGAGGVSLLEGDARLEADHDGVMLVSGDLALDATVRGLLLVTGSLAIGPRGAVQGAVHVAGHARVDGRAALDACAVAVAAATAGLDRPRLLPHRPSVPAF